jgi:hypothetical protein
MNNIPGWLVMERDYHADVRRGLGRGGQLDRQAQAGDLQLQVRQDEDDAEYGDDPAQ